jgi:L-lactate dehydrogenase complex protein LldG
MTSRAEFLARIRNRPGSPPSAGPHASPPPLPFEVRYQQLDGVARDPLSLLAVFVAAAEACGAVVHVCTDVDVGKVVAALAEQLDVRRVTLTSEPEVQVTRPALERAGVEVSEDAAAADLGVTSAVSAVAVTGSVVLDAGRSAGRGTAVLPTVHCCIVPVERLVATPADVLHGQVGRLPSSLTFVSGPSRTGDIETIVTIGVHGPVAVHVVVTTS